MKKTKKIEDDEIKAIAQALKQLRIKAGYTSYENFAVENGLDRKQYWRIEDGTNLTIKTLLRILKIHGISLKKFIAENLKG